MSRVASRCLAGGWAILCHGGFLVAVAWMVAGLAGGMRCGLGTLHGAAAALANAVLLLQFPLLHSALLTRSGRRLLARTAPGAAGATLAPTAFATFAACQVLLTFALWSPSGIVWYRPSGVLAGLGWAAFAGAWLFLGRAILEGNPGLQTGAIGWRALWRGTRVDFGPLPTNGLYRRCRHPIYLGFALTLWTGPVWTPDHLAIALTWSTYCLIGPLAKERRLGHAYGERFSRYRRHVPYMFPRLIR